MSRWFRHYGGMMRDEKLVSAAVKSKQSVERVVWVWGAILESASEVQDGGRYEFDADEAAYFLRCDPSDICSIIAALENLERIREGVVVRWSDRQYESDTSTERVRKHRGRRNGVEVQQRSDVSSQGGNTNVTELKRYVTPPETEADTERKNMCDAHDDFWEVCPKKVGKGASKKAWKGAILKTSSDTIITAMKAFASKQAGKDEKYIPHPATWLNQERWQDADLQEGAAKSDNFSSARLLLERIGRA